MERPHTGEYEFIPVAGERVRAYIPAPLPPQPGVVLSPPLLRLHEQALTAIGELNAQGTYLPCAPLLLFSFIRKEAVLSSEIEGTQSSLSDLLASEMENMLGVPNDDVTEVSNYVAAIQHGLHRLQEGMPLSLRLLREMHSILLQGGRGATKTPGEFRTSQNWIGGSRPGNAAFVPPPPHRVMECMGALELFIHDDGIPLPVLIKTALVHVQFETIHPFLDGNGRVGRLLMIFMLCHAGILKAPLLYLSLYFKVHRSEYYQLLTQTRRTGDWEAWIHYFLKAVICTAQQAVESAQMLMQQMDHDEEQLRRTSRISSSVYQVLELFQSKLAMNSAQIVKESGLKANSVHNALSKLTELGILAEITGYKRNRMYVYDACLRILNREFDSETAPATRPTAPTKGAPYSSQAE